MAFMNRGSMPSIGKVNIGEVQDNNLKGEPRDEYHRGGWHYSRYYCYIPLDNTYVVIQMVVTFIILIVGLIAFLATYKSTIIDPIESMKKLFINTYLIIIGILLATTLIINFLLKSKASRIKSLVIILIISILVMFGFLVMKFNLDRTYTKDRFEQFYAEQNIGESSIDSTKTKIDIGITGVSIKTEKEYYIDECLKLYGIFSSKTYGALGIHLLLNILLIYQISRISKVQGKKEKLNKDDLILFDEEQNVKI